MQQTMGTSVDADNEAPGKHSPGRGVAVIVYALYLASIMMVVTAPIAALIAWLRLGRGAVWVDSHLQFQLRTFCLAVLGCLLALLLWQLLGMINASSVLAWSLGYLFFTAGLAWFMGRCAVGIHRLTSNRPIENPRSLAFGGASARSGG